MFELLHFDFVQNALLASVLISIACGVVGTLVVVNRMVFISGGIAHASYGGIGLAVYLGIPPLAGASVFALFVSVLIGILTFRNRHRVDTVIGALWAAGMSFGIILLDISSGYHADLMSYLFGSILTIPRSDLWGMLFLDISVLLFTAVFYRQILALSFDPEFATVRGVKVALLQFLMLGLTALTVVLTMRLVGLILVIALLTIPVSVCEELANSLGKVMAYSFLGSMFTIISGLLVSYIYNLTSGASIILVASSLYFIFATTRLLRRRIRSSRPLPLPEA